MIVFAILKKRITHTSGNKPRVNPMMSNTLLETASSIPIDLYEAVESGNPLRFVRIRFLRQGKAPEIRNK